MTERTVSFGWKEDVHELVREILHVKESGERTKLISMVGSDVGIVLFGE